MDSAARQDDVDVLVVGAGPTGLMLANWLAELGVSSAIIDGDDGPMSESRALGVHSRSMEIYDQLGVVDRVLAEAVRAESMRQCFGRTAFAPIPLTGLGQGITPYPGMCMLEQSASERILAGNLGALGGTVRWRHRLTALDRHDDGVVVPVDTPSDRSAIRASPGLRQHPPGHRRIPPRFSHARGWRGTERAAPHRHRRGRRRLQGDGGLRAAPPRGRLRRCVRGPPPVLHLQGPPSDRGAVPLGGSVFLAGDAAHVHSPVGAQGMNTGLQDAHNLAFKLHDVVVGRAPAALLDRYEIERRPVAQRLLRTTDTLFLGITTRSPLAGLVRKYVPRAALPFGVAILPHLPIGRRLAGYFGQIRTHYRMEARSGHRPRGSRLHRDPVVGRRLPWTGRNFDALKSAQWQLHLYAADTTGLGRAEDAAHQLRLPLHRFGGTGSTRLKPGLLYLVRRDGFVAAASPPRTPSARSAQQEDSMHHTSNKDRDHDEQYRHRRSPLRHRALGMRRLGEAAGSTSSPPCQILGRCRHSNTCAGPPDQALLERVS